MRTCKALIATLLFVLAACSFPQESGAYDSVNRGFDWRTANSDQIVIGEVVAVTDDQCAFGSKCATVKIISLIKGERRETIKVLFGSTVSGYKILCCANGGVYLFYLSRKKDADAEYFESIDGIFGVYELDNRKRRQSRSGSN